jgi:hypothetical protein
MSMSDAEDYQYYADPDNREPAGPGRRRRGASLSSHVPIRFRPDVIARVKEHADRDRKTVSSWIRDIVEMELDRRRLYETRSAGTIGPTLEFDLGGDHTAPKTTVGV